MKRDDYTIKWANIRTLEVPYRMPRSRQLPCVDHCTMTTLTEWLEVVDDSHHDSVPSVLDED
jgi:hypothetical protein